MPPTEPTSMLYPPTHNNREINELLEKLDKEIRDFVRRKFPRSLVSPELFDIEVDELVQITRTKLWKALQKNHIDNPTAYAKKIAINKCNDMFRRQNKLSILLTIDYCDLDQADIIAQGVQDPAEEYEQKEAAAAYADLIVQGVLLLPRRQQYALLCDLKDIAADIPSLGNAFSKYGLNLREVHWPEDQDEVYKLRASRSIGRKKLMVFLHDKLIEA